MGMSNLGMASRNMGINQNTVLTVAAPNVAMPRRFLSDFLSNNPVLYDRKQYILAAFRRILRVVPELTAYLAAPQALGYCDWCDSPKVEEQKSNAAWLHS